MHCRTRVTQGAGWILRNTLFFPFFISGLAVAQEDSITLLNGDRLSGEIKSLDRGMLNIDTDATDTIAVRWDHVTDLSSSQSFLVTLSNGQRVFGSLAGVNADNAVALRTLAGELQVSLLDIVRLAPIEGRLIEQIDMDVELGYSVAKANNVIQTTAGYDFGFRNEGHQVQLVSDYARSSSEDRSDSQRMNVALSYRRFFTDRVWSPVGLAQIERNDELGLRRRTTVGGGMSRYLTDTNERQVNFMGAMVKSQEDATDAVETKSSVEAMTGLNIQWFRYDSPELDVSSQLLIFERISGQSRTRGNLDLSFKWELIEDFNWGMSIYYSFDSAPENAEASGNDYGVVATLGWSF